MQTKRRGRKSRKMKTRKMKRGHSYLAKKSKNCVGGSKFSKKKAEIKAAVREALIKYLNTSKSNTSKPSILNSHKTKTHKNI